MLDRSYTQSFWYFDGKDILREQTSDGGIGDSSGRTAFAYICFPNESFLKDAILKCVGVRDDSFVQFYRYPGFGAETMSRDHVAAIILALYINRDYDELDFILHNLPWRLSRKYRQTIDFWLWQKTLKNRKTKFEYWSLSSIFLLLTFVQFCFVIPWNWLIRLIIGVKKIDPHKYVYRQPSKWKLILYKAVYPHFALFTLAWQIKTMPGSILKWVVQKLLLIESANIVIDAVLGGRKVNPNDYIGTTSFIWSRRIDSFDNIMMRPMSPDESRFNDINQAMIDYLYFGIDRIMMKSPEQLTRSIKNNSQIITY